MNRELDYHFLRAKRRLDRSLGWTAQVVHPGVKAPHLAVRLRVFPPGLSAEQTGCDCGILFRRRRIGVKDPTQGSIRRVHAGRQTCWFGNPALTT